MKPIERYADVQAVIERLESIELAQSREMIDDALGGLEKRLAASVQSELARFEKEHGFQPAEIEVRMADASSVEDRWRRYRLTQIECRY